MSDGRLVSGSLDCTIKFWDISGPEDLYPFECTMTRNFNKRVRSLVQFADNMIACGCADFDFGYGRFKADAYIFNLNLEYEQSDRILNDRFLNACQIIPQFMPITMVRRHGNSLNPESKDPYFHCHLSLHGCTESELQESLPLIQPIIQLVDFRFVLGLRDGSLRVLRLRHQDDLETGPSVLLMQSLLGHRGCITAICQ